MMVDNGAFGVTLNLVFAMLTLSLFLSFFRLVIGPSQADRVVALDLIMAIVVGFIAVYCVAMRQPVFIDAAIAFALIAFVGTVAFARYLEKRGHRHD
jgi:multicomponent Na+:H+ antiporter subunit F